MSGGRTWVGRLFCFPLNGLLLHVQHRGFLRPQTGLLIGFWTVHIQIKHFNSYQKTLTFLLGHITPPLCGNSLLPWNKYHRSFVLSYKLCIPLIYL